MRIRAKSIVICLIVLMALFASIQIPVLGQSLPTMIEAYGTVKYNGDPIDGAVVVGQADYAWHNNSIYDDDGNTIWEWDGVWNHSSYSFGPTTSYTAQDGSIGFYDLTVPVDPDHTTGSDWDLTFTVTWNVTATYNNQSKTSQTITTNGGGGFNNKLLNLNIVGPVISGPAPVANFTAAPLSGIVPLLVTFTDTSTGSPTAWNWSFGDNSANVTTQNASYTYNIPGTYTAILTATNNNGSSSTSQTLSVTAAPVPVVASFTASQTSGNAPLTVTFTDTSSGSPTAWQWNFGDGANNVTDQNTSHTYEAAGTYTAVLTATKGSESSSFARTITVSAPLTLPAVTSVSPLSGATNVTTSTAITATFNVDINASTLTSGFTIKDSGNNAVAGAVSYNASSKTATFTPQASLANNKTYTATIAGITDTSGNAMASPYAWSFTTAAAVITTTPVDVTTHATLSGGQATVEVTARVNKTLGSSPLNVTVSDPSQAAINATNQWLAENGKAINATPLAMITVVKNGFNNSDIVPGTAKIIITMAKPANFSTSTAYYAIRQADDGSYETLTANIIGTTSTTITFEIDSPNGFCTFLLTSVKSTGSTSPCASMFVLPLLVTGVIGLSVIRKRRNS